MLSVETCRDVEEQRFTYSERGELQPARAPELCVAAAAGRSQSASRPEYVRRDLLLHWCDRADTAVIQWRVPGRHLGPVRGAVRTVSPAVHVESQERTADSARASSGSAGGRAHAPLLLV